MDIQINLLPEEFRPRPAVSSRALLLTFLVVALLAGAVFLYMLKSDADSDRVAAEERTAEVTAEANSISSNQEAVALNNSISRLKAAEKAFSAFVAARIDWGDTVGRAESLVPKGIELQGLTQAGGGLVIDGITTIDYSPVTAYARALDIDGRFTLAGVPSLSASSFSIELDVAPGGGS
jgi:hypothetical protein